MDRAGCIYILIHKYITITINENEAMNLSGGEDMEEIEGRKRGQ